MFQHIIKLCKKQLRIFWSPSHAPAVHMRSADLADNPGARIGGVRCGFRCILSGLLIGNSEISWTSVDCGLVT